MRDIFSGIVALLFVALWIGAPLLVAFYSLAKPDRRPAIIQSYFDFVDRSRFGAYGIYWQWPWATMQRLWFTIILTALITGVLGAGLSVLLPILYGVPA